MDGQHPYQPDESSALPSAEQELSAQAKQPASKSGEQEQLLIKSASEGQSSDAFQARSQGVFAGFPIDIELTELPVTTPPQVASRILPGEQPPILPKRHAVQDELPVPPRLDLETFAQPQVSRLSPSGQLQPGKEGLPVQQAEAQSWPDPLQVAPVILSPELTQPASLVETSANKGQPFAAKLMDRSARKVRALWLKHGAGKKWQRNPLLIVALLLLLIGIISPLIIFSSLSRGGSPQTASGVHKSPDSSMPPPQAASPTSTPVSKLSPAESTLASNIDSVLNSQVAAQQFSGSVLVARKGKIILAKGYSMANWDAQVPNTPNTRFYLGSVTKEFTAMSLLILQERGKINLQNSVCSYIPNCPASWQPVTVQEIVTHTSGIPELDTDSLSGDSPASWIASWDDASLVFDPGSQFSYCSTCYQILGYVVQQVSGEPYDQFVEQNILSPLHMDQSGFDTNAYYAASNSATGYVYWQVSAEELGWGLDPSWSFLDGSGLLYSTVEDLYRWDQALYTNQLVSQRSLKAAFTPYTPADLFPDSQYGYGWFITPAPVQGHRLIWHDGIIDGFRNFIGRYIDDDTTIIIQSNLSSTDVVALSHSIEQQLFGRASTN